MAGDRRSHQQTRIPSYRLHKPSGLGVVTLNGQDVYLGRHGTEESHRQYERVIAEWLANGRRRPRADERPLTIVELIVAYFEHAEGYYRKNGRTTSEVDCLRSALRPLRRLYEDLPAKEFGPKCLKAVRQVMIENGWTRSTINQQVGRIRSMFKWAVESEMLPAHVHQSLMAVRGLAPQVDPEARETEPVRPVPEEHIEAVRPLVSRQVRAMIDLQLLTGMRPGEVTIMRTCDLDVSGRVWVYRPLTHKTEHHGHQHPIYVGPQAKRVLEPFLQRDVRAFLFSPAEAEAERLASSRQGKAKRGRRQRRQRPERQLRTPADHYAVASYRRAIAMACVRADVAAWTPHRLRHNAATRLRAEYGIEIARVILGHRSAHMTEVNAELDTGKAKEVVARIG